MTPPMFPILIIGVYNLNKQLTTNIIGFIFWVLLVLGSLLVLNGCADYSATGTPGVGATTTPDPTPTQEIDPCVVSGPASWVLMRGPEGTLPSPDKHSDDNGLFVDMAFLSGGVGRSLSGTFEGPATINVAGLASFTVASNFLNPNASPNAEFNFSMILRAYYQGTEVHSQIHNMSRRLINENGEHYLDWTNPAYHTYHMEISEGVIFDRVDAIAFSQWGIGLPGGAFQFLSFGVSCG